MLLMRINSIFKLTIASYCHSGFQLQFYLRGMSVAANPFLSKHPSVLPYSDMHVLQKVMHKPYALYSGLLFPAISRRIVGKPDYLGPG